MERAAYRLTAPGLGKEVGASLGVSQSLYQGLFLSPTVVAGALKGAIFAANVYEKLGFGVVPNGTESRHDIIQAITFGTPEGVIKFCEGIQAAAPVDSFVTPEPWAMRDTILMSSWQQERSFRGPQSNFPQTVRSSRRTRYTSRADSHGIMLSSVS